MPEFGASRGQTVRITIAVCCWVLLSWGLLFDSPLARADALDAVHKRGTLIWGADQEGGGPYVYTDEKTGELVGFEVELADMLAKELGVKAQFQQGDWDNLPALLDSTIDVVLNGYEITPDRARLYRCTRPYYQFGLQLLAKTGGQVNSWADLTDATRPAHLSVAALQGSSAESYLISKCRSDVEIKSYLGTTDALSQVAAGVNDATVQDDCAAVFYADRYPELKFVGRPVDGGYYVAMVGHDEERLQIALNDALGKIIDDGRLKKLYDKWDMAGRIQMLALRNSETPVASAARSGWAIVWDNMGVLLEAAGMTVFLSLTSMPLAIAIGILIAIGRMYGPWPIAKPLGLYVEVLRGTPLMLQLYAIFFLIPHLGIPVNALVAAIAGLAINYSAYEAEIYRAGLQAIPRGQMEAALSLGLTRGQAIRRIILPQAFRLVIPPVTNDFIALFKDTSVCSVVTVVELTKRYNILAQNTGAIVELAAVTALLYLLMSYPLSLVARWSERRLGGEKLI